MSKGQTVGYVRVSTTDQNTERQLDGLELDKVFTDHASGKDTDRPALTECLGYVRDGDELFVHSMDRLARSLMDLRRIVDDLTERGVSARFVKEGLTFTRDTADPCAVLMLSVMGAVAEFERSLLLERQREGIALAKEKGVYKGRVPSLSADQAFELDRRMADGESASAIAREYGISRATVYNTRWTEADIIAVDDVYREHGLPTDEKHPTVQTLASNLGRTPSAVYMRMVQLDYAHKEPGVYPGVIWHWTKLDRKVADRVMRQPWTEDHVISVDEFYRKHGLLDANHPEVQALAHRLGRVPTAVAMKLVDLDKAHAEPGVYPGKHWRFSEIDRKVADR